MTTPQVTRLPAICRSCSKPFPSGLAVGGNAQSFHYGVTSGPCPYCGGMGDVPDGASQQIEGHIAHIADLNPTAEDMQAARVALIDFLMKDGWAPTSASASAMVAKTGSLRDLVSGVLSSPKTSTALGIGSLIFSAIAIVQSQQPPPPQDVNVHVTIVEGGDVDVEITPSSPPPR